MIMPEFKLLNQDNKYVEAKTILGKKNIIIFFYPKDFTPVCTKEACFFQDNYSAFNELDATIIGISSDSVESHKKFANHYKLKYDLLSDVNGDVSQLFKIKKYLGILKGRETFVIDKSGKVIKHITSRFTANDHIKQSLKVLRKLA